MKKLLKRRGRSGESGNALVEFAIGGTMLVTVFAGVFQFGYTFYVYNNVQTAVNNGAKYAALRSYENTDNSPSSWFTTAVQDMVAYGDPTGTSTTSVAPGLTPAKVSLAVTFTNGVPSQMQVYIGSYTINSIFASYTLTNKPSATYPYLGRYDPTNTCVQ
jgi:Flp pilus assembly protein TadG